MAQPLAPLDCIFCPLQHTDHLLQTDNSQLHMWHACHHPVNIIGICRDASQAHGFLLRLKKSVKVEHPSVPGAVDRFMVHDPLHRSRASALPTVNDIKYQTCTTVWWIETVPQGHKGVPVKWSSRTGHLHI